MSRIKLFSDFFPQSPLIYLRLKLKDIYLHSKRVTRTHAAIYTFMSF